MRAFIPVLLISTIAGAYALGRMQRLEPVGVQELGTLQSFRSAFDQPNVLERSYLFHGFLETMGPDEVDEAAEVVDAFNPWLVSDELTNFMIAWASFDPRAALDWGLTRRGSFRPLAAGAAIGGWASHDPAGAQLALEELEPDRAPPGMEAHLISGWLSHDKHDRVAEYIATRPAGIDRQLHTNLLTIELMRDGPDAVMRWAESVPGAGRKSYRRTAFQKAANIVATVDPLIASEWVEAHLHRGYADGLPGVVAQRWLDLDPPAALEWLASLPAGEHDAAVKTTFLTWLNRSPESAKAWLLEAAPAPSLDTVVELMLSRSGDDTESAIEWASRFADAATRYRFVVRMGRSWLRDDPGKAKAWLAQSTLSPGLKSAIQSPVKSAPGKSDSPKARALPGAETPGPGSPG